MKIVATVGEIMEAGNWDEFCDSKGWDRCCVAEGLAEEGEEVVLTVEEAKECWLLPFNLSLGSSSLDLG